MMQHISKGQVSKQTSDHEDSEEQDLLRCNEDEIEISGSSSAVLRNRLAACSFGGIGEIDARLTHPDSSERTSVHESIE